LLSARYDVGGLDRPELLSLKAQHNKPDQGDKMKKNSIAIAPAR
jgi:hypothetical protein